MRLRTRMKTVFEGTLTGIDAEAVMSLFVPRKVVASR